MITAIKNAFTNLLKTPHTHPYPAKPLPIHKNYRGLIEFDAKYCIWCDKCEKVCPPGAILFKQLKDGKKIYNYNPYLCIYCNDCVIACPKSGDALWQSESKGLPSLEKDNPNEKWYKLEKECKQSREEYRLSKNKQKNPK